MVNKSNEKLLHIMVVEPRGSGGMIHYAYQLCSALSNVGARVTLVTSDEYEMEGLSHNFTVRKQMKLWSPTETTKLGITYQDIARKSYRAIRHVARGIRLIVEWIHLTIYLIKARPDIIQFGKIEFPFEAIFLHVLKRNGFILSQICHEFESREHGKNPLTGLFL